MYTEDEIQAMYEEALLKRHERYKYKRQQMISSNRSTTDIELLDIQERTFIPLTLDQFKIQLVRYEQEKQERQQRKDAILRGELPRRVRRVFGRAVIEHDDPVLSDEELE